MLGCGVNEPWGPGRVVYAPTTNKKCNLFTQYSTALYRASGSVSKGLISVRGLKILWAVLTWLEVKSKHNRPAPASSRGRAFAWHANRILGDQSKQHGMDELLLGYRPYLAGGLYLARTAAPSIDIFIRPREFMWRNATIALGLIPIPPLTAFK